jgi:hypothetical protein
MDGGSTVLLRVLLSGIVHTNGLIRVCKSHEGMFFAAQAQVLMSEAGKMGVLQEPPPKERRTEHSKLIRA